MLDPEFRIVMTLQSFRKLLPILPILSLAVSACWNTGSSSPANNDPVTAVVLNTGSVVQNPDDLSGEDPGSCGLNATDGMVDCDIIYAATNGGGIFKSTDGGNKFRQIVNGLPHWNVTDLVIDPEMPDMLYAGTQDSGLYTSFNGGESWFPVIQAAISSISDIVIDSNTCQTSGFPCRDIYVASEDTGILFSHDGGSSWGELNLGLDSPSVTALGIFSYGIFPSVVYAGTAEGKIYVFNRQTQKWDKLLPGFGESSAPSILVIAVNPFTPTEIYVGTSGGEGESQGGTFRSVDGGHTWDKVDIPNAASFSVRVLAFCIQIEARCPPTVADVDTSGKKDERTKDVLYAGVYGLSRNFFVDNPFWENIDLGGQIQTGNNVSAIGIDNIRHTSLYAGTLLGFLVISRDAGATWTRVDLEL
jgi:photosystem II stability/assembly factor-like uncharacterized protein